MHMLYALTALRDSKQQAADQISPVETKCEPSDNSYDRFWSESAKSRTPSYIRTLQKYLKDPEVISFGGGLPNPSTFPFESASFKLKSGDKISFNMEEMQQVLQYGASTGDNDLIAKLKEIQIKEHKAYKEFDLMVSVGCADLIDKVFDLFLNPGDIVIIESPCYVEAITCLKGRQVKCLEVSSDTEGINAAKLDQILTSWPSNIPKPKLLYTIPTGCNPTGKNTSLKRKIEVLKLAHKHDFMIVEDDPYYYLQFNSEDKEERTASYLSLDQNVFKRVVRLDSFSKIAAPGLRIGCASGPSEVISKLVIHQMATTGHPCRLAQALLLKWLDQIGFDGFMKHCQEVCSVYKKRRDTFLSSLRLYLSESDDRDYYAKWEVPQAGMFVWAEFFVKQGDKHIALDTFKMIDRDQVKSKILIVPGSEFYFRHKRSSHVRLSYATPSEQEMELGMHRIVAMLSREASRINSAQNSPKTSPQTPRKSNSGSIFGFLELFPVLKSSSTETQDRSNI